MAKKILFLSSLLLLVFTGCSNSSENSLAIINENGKYGTLENNSEVVIKPIYDEMSSFDDVENKNIKTKHPNLLNLHWLHNYYGDEYTVVEYNGKYGIINRKNEMVVKPIYDSISKLFNGFSVIKIDDKYGYMNKKFEVVQKPIFKKAREFFADATFVQSNANGKWGCITKDMNLKINDEYDEIYNYVDGFARTVKDGKWGYIDGSCNVLAQPKYDYAFNFSRGFAKVILNGKTAYINSKGKEITKSIFSRGENF